MKKIKIFAAFLAAVLIFMQCALVPMAADFSDTAGTKYEEAVGVLSSLGIVNGMEDGTFAPEKTLTRAEMTAIITRALRMENWEEERTAFADVSEEHWAYYPITTAHSLGIVNGVDSTSFLPDAEVTASQAIKMVVSLLGYQVQAEAEGGYPAGYITRAVQLDLLDGIESGEAALSRGDMALLMYRALDVPLLQRLSFGDDAYTFQPVEGETLLSSYMHIEKSTGVIEAGFTQEITAPARRLREDEISFGGQIYRTGTSDAADRVGERVVLYTETAEDETKTVLAAVSKSKTVTVDARSILDDTTKQTFFYEADGREEKVSTAGATVLFNGMPKTDYTAASLQPDTGSVKLIFEGTSLCYILVESYENYQIKIVNKSGLRLTFYENRMNVNDVSFDNDASTVFVDAEGAACSVEKCAKENILSVAESENGKYRKMVLSTAVAEGVLSEVSEESIRVGDQEYEIAKSLQEAPGFALPAIGISASYALNMNGQIAGLMKDSAKEKLYGWLRGAQMTKGLNARPQLKIFTQDGEMKVFDTTENVRFNETNIPANQLLPSGGNALFDGTAAKEQLVMYRLAEGKITEIDTAEDLRYNYDAPHRQDVFSLDAYVKPGYKLDDGSDTWMMYMGGGLDSFGRNWMVRDETVIFVLPGSNEDKDFYIKTADTMKHGTEYTEIYDDVSMFDITDEQIVSVLIWDRRDEAGTELSYPEQETKFAIISGNTRSLSEEGEPIYALSYTMEWGYDGVAYATEDLEVLFGEASTDIKKDPVVLANGGTRPNTTTVDKLNIGDIVQYETDNKGNLTKLSVLFRAESPGDYEQVSNRGTRTATTKHQNYGSRVASYGTVEDITKYGLVSKVNLLDLTTDGPSGVSVSSIMIYPSRIYECNLKNGTVKAISKEEISVGDKALYVTRTNTPAMLIVYK